MRKDLWGKWARTAFTAAAAILAGIYQELLGPAAWVVFGLSGAFMLVTWGGWRRVKRAARRAWAELRQEDAPTSPTVRGEHEHCQRARLLLQDAASFMRGNTPKLNATEIRDIWDAAWHCHLGVPNLLTRMFLVSREKEFRDYLDTERLKRGDAFNVTDASAAYLDRLSGRLNCDDLDPDFLLPRSYEQFATTRTEWPADVPEIPHLVAYGYNEWDDCIFIANDAATPVYEVSLAFQFGPYEVTQTSSIPIARLDAGEKHQLKITTSRYNEDRSVSFMEALGDCMREWEAETKEPGQTYPFTLSYRDSANRWYRARCEACRNVLVREGGVEITTKRHERLSNELPTP